jgi:diguanylate cyclase (GGDEF)-like protein/PAS domain S-box-containing protein
MAVLIVISILMVVAFVIVSAGSQNRLAIDSSTALARTALQVKQRELARNIKDYAIWDDAYKNLAKTFNFVWASTDGNVGANVYNGLGYDLALVMSPDNQVIYSVVGGIPQKGFAGSPPDGLMAMVKLAVNQDNPTVGLLRHGQEIMLVAAASILPASGTAPVPVSQRSTLIFAKSLNSTFLASLGHDYLLSNLTVDPMSSAPATASIPLAGPGGNILARLEWTPEQPGYELLKLQLPPLSAAAVILATFAWLVVRNARKSTKALEESAQTVEAFAQTLKESEARFRDVAEASSDWIWECDRDLRFAYFSTRFSQVTGIAAASVLGKLIEQFFFSDEKSDGWTRLLEGAHGHAHFRDLRCCYRDAKLHTRICRLAGGPILGADGTFTGYRGTATDITEEVEAQARANHLALHDSLTGLPNRVLFRERLDQALVRNSKDNSRVAVLCLDLDHFKEVNDTLGHGAGDVLLKELAERLKACVRPTDTVARLGGDEFAVIQVGVNQPVEVGALSRKIMTAVKAPFNINDQELYVGVSIGIALPEGAGDDPGRLLKNADIALYRAKQAGRGTMRFFEAQMDIELQARKALEQDLRQALLKNELEVFYQPIIDLEGRIVTAVEALVRWRHPSRGLVSPADFIPMAEETGLVIAIGEWVLRTACKQVQEWPGLHVAVNLSPVQFRNREIIETVKQVLVDTGLLPDRLELEITESVLINDSAAALRVLCALKEIGVNIAMDDFGTGYSSLVYLNSFPFDKIKIDRSFISSISETEKSTAIVKSIISLGQSLSMTTTAEGVETSEQAEFLLKEGCTHVQGYFFGRPVPAGELTIFLTTWKGFVDAPPSPSIAAA